MQEGALDLGGQARAEAETIQTDPSRRGQLSERAEAGVTFAALGAVPRGRPPSRERLPACRSARAACPSHVTKWRAGL